MNILKTTIATAAVITCCLGNEMPAKSYDLCDSVVDGYMEMREEIYSMDLDAELTAAADAELYGGYMDSRELTGCY